MKHGVLILALLCATPALSEEVPSERPPSETEEGWNMLREGSKLLLQELFDQMGPTLEQLEGFAEDLNAYEPPVILPNGDILIRRKPDVPKPTEPENVDPDGSDEAIDL